MSKRNQITIKQTDNRNHKISHDTQEENHCVENDLLQIVNCQILQMAALLRINMKTVMMASYSLNILTLP